MKIILKTKIILISILIIFIFPNLLLASALDQFNEKKYNSAFRTAFTEATSGNPEAAFVLGKLYMLGLGDVKKNPSKAIKNLKFAINKKYYPAAVFLANEYQKGKNIKRNYAEARRMFIKAQNLGGPNFSKKIALLSQKMSDDDLSTDSCRDAKKAAEKNARSFYLYYTRCMLKEVGVKKDISLIQNYIEKVKYKTQQEEIVSLAKILAEGPKEIRNPAEAYILIEKYIKDDNPEASLKKDLENLRDNIQFKIEDCLALVKKDNKKNTIFVCTKIEKSNNVRTLISLYKIYKNNINIFNNFDENKKQVLKKGVELGSIESLQLLASYYKQNDQTQDFLDFLTNSQNNKSLSSNIKNEIKIAIKEQNLKLLKELEKKPSIKNTIVNSIASNNCDLLIQVVNKADIKLLKKISTEINSNDLNCQNDPSLEMIMALKNLQNSKTKSAFFTLKELCAQEINNSCLVLAEMYMKDNLPSSMDSFDKADKIEFAIDNLTKSVDLGNINAMVPLADLLLANNKDEEKAKLIIEKAIKKGKVDGLYIKARHALKNVFFADKKTCKPLRQFLSNNVSNSKYYEKAIQLNKKRCK